MLSAPVSHGATPRKRQSDKQTCIKFPKVGYPTSTSSPSNPTTPPRLARRRGFFCNPSPFLRIAPHFGYPDPPNTPSRPATPTTAASSRAEANRRSPTSPTPQPIRWQLRTPQPIRWQLRMPKALRISENPVTGYQKPETGGRPPESKTQPPESKTRPPISNLQPPTTPAAPTNPTVKFNATLRLTTVTTSKFSPWRLTAVGRTLFLLPIGKEKT